MSKHIKYKSIYLLLTNSCNAYCTFCYRKNLDKSLFGQKMTEETAFKAIEFVIDNLDLEPDFNFFFWGGEPLTRFDLIQSIMKKYPQFNYSMSTNGALMNQEMYEFFTANPMVHITWSLAVAHEKYGGIKEMMEACPWATKLVREQKHTVNFMVTDYKNMFDDVMYIYENLSHNVTIGPELKKSFTDEQMEDYVNNYVKLLSTMKLGYETGISNSILALAPSWHKEFGGPMENNQETWLACNTGVEIMYVDPTGGLWQCDAFYILRRNQLGHIDTGIDFSKLDYIHEYRENPKIIAEFCDGCEIYGICPRKKCLGGNIELTGHIFKPYPGFCQINKAIIRILKQYTSILKGKKV